MKQERGLLEQAEKHREKIETEAGKKDTTHEYWKREKERFEKRARERKEMLERFEKRARERKEMLERLRRKG